MNNFEIIFYKTTSGQVPVQDFLESLSPKIWAKASDSLRLLGEYGNQLKMPLSKSLGKGLFELRVQFSNDITRIFYFFYSGNRIILTNGFIKKTMKTPKREIEKARKYKKDWEERNNG